jgi:toxin ParE1/3/4
MTEQRAWSVRLSSAAQSDYQDILDWTAEHFGEAQSDTYAITLDDAIDALSSGTHAVGVREISGAPGLYLIHVARRGRKGRHFLIFRTNRRKSGEFIEVLRILHDSMDLARHLPPME